MHCTPFSQVHYVLSLGIYGDLQTYTFLQRVSIALAMQSAVLAMIDSV